MHIGVTGSTGLIGSALVEDLRSAGHRVVPFVRSSGPVRDGIAWQPGADLDPGALKGLDAVVHLAGAGLADRRWTSDYRRVIRDSRVDGTSTIARAMAAAEGPTALVCGSAIGYYGDTGDRLTDETGPHGVGFLADVVRDWETAARPAVDAGVRVAFARTGLVLTSRGGGWRSWSTLLLLLRLGLGGRIGSGTQYWPTISLHDEVRALRWLIDHEIAGPVNLVGPRTVTNAEVIKAIARVAHRPAIIPVPAPALRAVLGDFAQDMVTSQRIDPAVLRDTGFQWDQPDNLSIAQEALSGG
jgi:uncharacterized protein (TIGR01777 family)